MNLRRGLLKVYSIVFGNDASTQVSKQVAAVLEMPSGTSYPICPRCDCTLDREYMQYCDRCGQRLSWERFDTAAVIYAPRRKEHE